ncbi:hypothetical protein [Rhizobium binxianense]
MTGAAVLGVLGFAAPSLAGNCMPGAGAASQQQIQSFRASPASIISGSPGSTDVSDLVRTLAATDTTLVDQFLQLAAAEGTSDTMKAAIGAGLGRAARVCRPLDSGLADEIAQAVATAAASNPALQALETAYGSALNQTAVAALGAAGPGAAAGAGAIGGAGAGAAGTGGGGEQATTAAGATNSDDGNSLTSTGSGGGGNFSTGDSQSLSQSSL